MLFSACDFKSHVIVFLPNLLLFES